MPTSPHIRHAPSVSVIMLKVLAALLPGIAAYVFFFGPGILIQLAIASATALCAEAMMLAIRRKPLLPFLGDGSALVTAWLLALACPPLLPWWVTAVGAAFAIVVVKHLYGGLGQNPFNPAMAGFCVLIVAYPAFMSQWPSPGLAFGVQLDLILGGARDLDGITAATALDALRTAQRAGTEASVAAIMAAEAAFGTVGARGWEWVAAGYALGGLWLIQQRVITWHVPVAFLLGLAVLSGVLWAAAPERFASPMFHLAAGGSMLAAFFIATDPVSGATTPKGKLVYAAGIALIAYVIRVFGAFPDGIAFATLLMNMCVPIIDMHTQPPVFGHKTGARDKS